MTQEFKINEIGELFDILQDGAGYNFEKKLEKCSKKKTDDDIGEESILAETIW